MSNTAPTFDDEVREKLGPRPQPLPGGKNWREVAAWERRFQELFPKGPIYMKGKKQP